MKEQIKPVVREMFYFEYRDKSWLVNFLECLDYQNSDAGKKVKAVLIGSTSKTVFLLVDTFMTLGEEMKLLVTNRNEFDLRVQPKKLHILETSKNQHSEVGAKQMFFKPNCFYHFEACYWATMEKKQTWIFRKFWVWEAVW